MSNYIRQRYMDDIQEIPDEVVIELNDNEKPKQKMRRTRFNKKTPPVTLSTAIDISSLWNTENNNRVTLFAGKNGLLKADVIKKMLEDLIVFDKKPIRSDVAKIMHNKPPVSQYPITVEPIIDKMVRFAEALKGEIE